MSKTQLKPLTKRSLRRAAGILAERDPDLKRIYTQFGDKHHDAA